MYMQAEAYCIILSTQDLGCKKKYKKAIYPHNKA